MTIEQIYTGCLAQGAYYIESKGEVAIIDPLREVQPYIDRASRDGAKIKYIFETHFHADFVSGHLTLSQKTDAPIIFGPLADPTFDATIAEDEQVFKLGDVEIKVLHTPGHTLECSSFLLTDETGKEHCLFSGDTLFLGDVGRPDLAQKDSGYTEEQLAGMLYDSLRNKIMPLADDLIIYPAHGAGSACGKNMMKETVDTLGNQRKVNYALREDMSRAEFITELTDGLEAPPAYFPLNVKLNREGYESIDKVIESGKKGLSPAAFEAAANETGAVVLDVRHQTDFINEHVPRSIFIGLAGGFAPWVGALIMDTNQELLLVVENGKEEEAITRLSRVGFDNVIGYLEGGVSAWKDAGKETDALKSISAKELEQRMSKNSCPVFDVRKDGEWNNLRMKEAQHASLSELNQHLAAFPAEQDFYIHCAGGYRSVIAASILKSRGIHNIVDIAGGFAEIQKTQIALSDEVCQNS